MEIETSSDPELEGLARAGYELPYFEFRSYVSRRIRHDDGTLQVTFRRGGIRREAPDASRVPELRREDAVPLRKLLRFRVVSSTGPMPCLH